MAAESILGIRLTFIGGDNRYLYLIKELTNTFGVIKTFGLPADNVSDQLINCNNIEQALDTDVIILPMPGINNQGFVYSPLSNEKIMITENHFKKIKKRTPIFVGSANEKLKFMAQNHRLVEIANLDEVAIYNSIPSAEGAIQIAMEESSITIHGSESYVLGFGRCGITLANMLKGLGAKVTVVARKPEHIARIFETGFRPIYFEELSKNISKAEIIFNTVPFKVLGKDIITKLSNNAIIVDIASAPGGTDFEAAQKQGIKAILAPGLPGKVAPKTAGKILARVLPGLITDALKS